MRFSSFFVKVILEVLRGSQPMADNGTLHNGHQNSRFRGGISRPFPLLNETLLFFKPQIARALKNKIINYAQEKSI
jgi:hypothetical protein